MPNSQIPSDAPISEEEKKRLKEENLKRKLALPVVKLSVGCGLHWALPLNEFINHDGLENEHTDIVSEFGSIPLPDACIDYMVLGDVCEHLPQYRVDEVWNEWTRLLKVGSKIHLGTPNFHRAMTEYTLHTLFGETMPSGWMNIKAIDASGKEHEVRHHVMSVQEGLTPHEAARRQIYAWGTSPYESHFITYTMETLTELLTRHGFVDIDFSDSPPQEQNDPRNSWWFVCKATYAGKNKDA